MYLIQIIFLGLISQSIFCDDIINRLTKRFNDLSKSCFDSNNRERPAYECSGIMLRDVSMDQSPLKFPWSKNEINKRTNAFSVAFFRADQLFSKFPHGYDAGFVIYPRLKTPHSRRENKQTVFCAFPVNAHCSYRCSRRSPWLWKIGR